MILGILIGIISYSLILTIINIYKDHSRYFELTMLDIIMSGPVTWIYFFCSFLFEFLILWLKRLGILKKKEHSFSYKKKIKEWILRECKKILIILGISALLLGSIYATWQIFIAPKIVEILLEEHLDDDPIVIMEDGISKLQEVMSGQTESTSK